MNVLHLTIMYPLSPDGIHSDGHAVYHLVNAIQRELGPDSQQVHLYHAYWAKYYWMFANRKRQTTLLGKKEWLPHLHFRGLMDLPTGKFSNFLNPLWQTIAGKLEAENGNYDIVHVHTSYALGKFGWLLASRHGKPLVITVRREMAQWHKLHPIRRQAILAGLNHADLIIAPSQLLAECTKKATGRSAVVIPNGTDRMFDEAPPNPDKRVHNRILFVGTLDKNKAILLLLNVVLKMLRNGVDVELYIAGQGSLENKIKKIADGHANITFLGKISQQAIRQHMRMAQILCVVSYSETFGIVYGEAMKQGAVVVARKGTGIDGMGVDGMHYQLIGKDDELAPRLTELLNDKMRCLSIRTKAMALAKKWSWTELARKHKEVYQELVQRDWSCRSRSSSQAKDGRQAAMLISGKESTATHHVAIIQRCFPLYRKALFSKLCSQEHPGPQYCLYYGQDVGQNSLKTILPDDLPKSDENITKKFRRLYNIRLWKNFVWQTGVIKIAIGREFDTVIFEGNAYMLSTWIASVLARLRGKRVLFWSHGFLQNEKGLKGWVRMQFYKLANALVLYGNRARNICLRKGFHPNSLYLVFNSLDLDTQVRIRESISDQDRESIKKQLFALPNMPLLLWVGRLTESKHLDLLLQATRLLFDRGTPVNVLIVGDGPAKDSLETLSRNLGLEQHVRFHGACYDEEKLGILISSADLCVGPGEIGLSCIHALTYGTPVVTHGSFDNQGPEVEAVISGRTGDFFRRGDSEDLAQVILNWLNRQQSQETIRAACYRQIDLYYNPEYQLHVFNSAVSGVSAKDILPMMTETTVRKFQIHANLARH